MSIKGSNSFDITTIPLTIYSPLATFSISLSLTPEYFTQLSNARQTLLVNVESLGYKG